MLAAEAGTLHRLLGSLGPARGHAWHVGRRLPLDLLVIDEASMVDLALLRASFEALPDEAAVLLVGDAEQLASVGTGSVLRDRVEAPQDDPRGDLPTPDRRSRRPSRLPQPHRTPPRALRVLAATTASLLGAASAAIGPRWRSVRVATGIRGWVGPWRRRTMSKHSVAVFGGLVVAVLAAGFRPAWGQSVHAYPPSVTVEAQLEAAGVVANPGSGAAVYFVVLPIGVTGSILRQAGPVTPNAQGLARARIGIGLLPVNNYLLAMREGTPTAPNVASTTFSVTPRLGLLATPDPARPGDTIDLTVRDLRPGTLRVQVSGVPALGPFNVADGTAVVRLPIPAAIDTTRPALVEAQNLDGDQVVGAGRLEVGITTPGFTGAARVTNLTGFSPTLPLNAPIDISGRLELPRGSAAGMQARLGVRFPNGRSLLLDDGRAVVGPNGEFRIRGETLSPWNGAPLVLPDAGDGETFIVAVDPEPSSGVRTGSVWQSIGLQGYSTTMPSTIGFDVVLRDPQGNPVRDAVVTFWGESGGIVPPPGEAAKAIGRTRTSVPRGAIPGTQIAGILEVTNPAIFARLRAECPPTLFRGRTDASGRVQVRLGPTALLVALTDNLNAAFNQQPPAHDTNAPIETRTRVRISALDSPRSGGQGFTFSQNAFEFLAGETFLTYDHNRNGWCLESNGDGCTSGNLGPLPTLNYTVRPYLAQIDLPVTVTLTGGLPRRDVTGQAERWGPIVTVPPLPEFADVTGVGSLFQPILARVTYNSALYGLLTNARIEWQPPGTSTWTQVANFTPSASAACASDDESEYAVFLDAGNGVDVPRLAWGLHRFRLLLEAGQRSVERRFDVEAVAPPAWWRQPPAGSINRRVTSYGTTGTGLKLDIDPPARTLSASPPQIGNIENRNRSRETWIGTAGAEGTQSFKREVPNNSRIANNDGTPAAGSFSGLDTGDIVLPTQTILNTGWVPVFRAAWGIPPIASATFGIDTWFIAQLAMRARTRVTSSGVASTLRVNPSVAGLVNAFINVSAILGLVDLTAEFKPGFTLSLPVQITNGVPQPPESCFNFRMDVSYSVSVGLCDLCVSASDSARLFNETVTDPPSNATSCPTNRADKAGEGKTLKALGIRRLTAPSLDFDPLGAGQLVRINDAGALETRPWTGGTFGAPTTLGSPPGAANVRHAYFAPGRAVMVYERSNLSSSAFNALPDTIEGVRQAATGRYLAFRTFNNGAWSNESFLTLAGTGGEGQVALAACPSTTTGCPTGGEVAAVWMRNPGGDAFGFQYEIWHAFYRNNAWTTATRLVAPGAGADMHPQVAYRGSQAVVTFTRSDARTIGSQATRRLMYVVLPGGTVQEIPGTAGTQWQSLTVDGSGRPVIAYTVAPDAANMLGNQSVLWSARGTCSGTTCTFATTQQRDALGRSIRAESPSIERMGDGSVRVAFRALGYGPNAQGVRVAPGDSLGVLTGTGELMSLSPRFTAGPVAPLALTADGLLNMNPLMRRHPTTGALVTLVDRATTAPFNAAAVRKALPFPPAETGIKTAAVDGSLVSLSVPDAAEFVVDAVIPVDTRLVPGSEIRVDVAIRNAGRAWNFEGTPLAIEAGWDGAPPSVPVAGGMQLAQSLPESGQQLVRITVRVPETFAEDDQRSLHVRVNGAGAIAEVDASNNTGVAAYGRLPVPDVPQVTEWKGAREVQLSWTRPDDPRIAGFRVWRAPVPAPGQEPAWYPVGSTYTEAFIDLTGDDGTPNWYRLTAFTARGAESAPGGIAIAARDIRSVDTVFDDSFEGPGGVIVVPPN